MHNQKICNDVLVGEMFAQENRTVLVRILGPDNQKTLIEGDGSEIVPCVRLDAPLNTYGYYWVSASEKVFM